jgi:TonB family protein
LTPEQIRDLLAKGAKPSDHTSIPSEDARCFEAIRQAFFRSWEQPSKAAVGDAVAELGFTLSGDGRVGARRLARSSGNALLDESVLAAARSVDRIYGLTPSFLSRHRDVTVSFKVE